MIRRDKIFFAAGVMVLAGIALAVAGFEFGLLLLVGAYLLRPALHEFGVATQYGDERQLIMHSRSGNIGFLVMIFAALGFALWRISRGESPEELYEIIFLGLAARAMTNLILVGEYRKAGVMIISTVGLLFGLFAILDGGLSAASLFGAGVAALILGLGQLARKFPRTIAWLLLLAVAAVIAGFRLYEFRLVQSALWLYAVTPLVTAAACLLLGAVKDEERITPRLRAAVFGSLGGAAVVIFALLLVIGGREQPVTHRSRAAAPGETAEIQGVSCTGSAEYFPGGGLKSCTLGREDTLSGQPLPAGTVVHLRQDGSLEWCFLPENTVIQGHLCLGSGHNFMTGFHPNGRLQTAWLAEDEVIQGIPCAKYRFMSSLFGGGERTLFDDQGRLRYCTLSEAATIDGQSLKKGTIIRLDELGRLRKVKE